MKKVSDNQLNMRMPSESEVIKERRRLQYGKEYRKVLATTIYTILIVAAVAVLIVTLVLPVLQVSGESMEPTFKDGDIVLLVRTENLETGDLCGFYWNNKLLLKRVIGTPGDIIKMDAAGNIYVNDLRLDESYISEKAYGECCNIDFPYNVPDNCYFLVGDSRYVSMDSRNTMIGAVSGEQILGKVVIKVWPKIKAYS